MTPLELELTLQLEKIEAVAREAFSLVNARCDRASSENAAALGVSALLAAAQHSRASTLLRVLDESLAHPLDDRQCGHVRDLALAVLPGCAEAHLAPIVSLIDEPPLREVFEEAARALRKALAVPACMPEGL